MTSVINPWVFYAMSVTDSLKTIAIITLIGSLIVAVIVFIMTTINLEFEGIDGDTFKFAKRLAKPLVGFIAAATLMIVLLPSSQTITKMLIAQNVTYERVEVAADTVREVYEDIMGLFANEE